MEKIKDLYDKKLKLSIESIESNELGNNRLLIIHLVSFISILSFIYFIFGLIFLICIPILAILYDIVIPYNKKIIRLFPSGYIKDDDGVLLKVNIYKYKNKQFFYTICKDYGTTYYNFYNNKYNYISTVNIHNVQAYKTPIHKIFESAIISYKFPGSFLNNNVNNYIFCFFVSTNGYKALTMSSMDNVYNNAIMYNNATRGDFILFLKNDNIKSIGNNLFVLTELSIDYSAKIDEFIFVRIKDIHMFIAFSSEYIFTTSDEVFKLKNDLIDIHGAECVIRIKLI